VKTTSVLPTPEAVPLVFHPSTNSFVKAVASGIVKLRETSSNLVSSAFLLN